MPFLGKDWRAPGEDWVKTEDGTWEKKSMVQMCSRKRTRSESEAESDDGSVGERNKEWQPHVFVPMNVSRERSCCTSLSDAIRCLDFPDAVRDIRRFNYVCKVTHYLITESLSSLSGSTQRLLFNTINEILQHVVHTKQNTGTLKLLMAELDIEMKECLKVGRRVGSTELWNGHKNTVHMWQHKLVMSNILSEIREKIGDEDKENLSAMKFTDLPDDCLRLILLRLSDHKDILNAGQAISKKEDLSGEQYLWRELCLFHFAPEQIRKHIPNEKEVADWRGAYHRLKRYCGLKEVYAEMLQLCCKCKCVFWKSIGHPCCTNDTAARTTPRCVPVPPHAFINFFM